MGKRLVWTLAGLFFTFNLGAGQSASANPIFNLKIQNFQITQNLKRDDRLGTGSYLLDNTQFTGQHVISCQCPGQDAEVISTARADIFNSTMDYRISINLATDVPQIQIYAFQIDKLKGRMIPKLVLLQLKFVKGNRKDYEAGKSVELEVIDDDQADLNYNFMRATETIYQQVYAYGISTFAQPREMITKDPVFTVHDVHARSIKVSKTEMSITLNGETSVSIELTPKDSLETSPVIKPIAAK